jgi:uncharacterized protein (TIGR03435 family)
MRTIVLMMTLSFAAFAQTFEVASIKPSDPNANGAMLRPLPDGVQLKGFTLKDMIVTAWGVESFYITGGPKWLDEARFDVMAKAGTPLKPHEMPLRLRGLLQDRFQVVVRQETREMPVYELVLARKDGKLGPKMVASPCPVYDEDHPAPTQPTAAQKGCGGSSGGPTMMRAKGGLLRGLVILLSRNLERTVIDKTGLTGKFDMTLDWSADQSTNAGPSIFTALEEQLGLKLVSSKGPVEMLVVERAEKPTGN